MFTAAAGDLIQLVNSRDQTSFIIRLEPRRKLETHRGILNHTDLIGQPYGSTVLSHLSAEFVLLVPSTAELTRTLKRSSQIIFPKDLGLILLKLSVEPGQRIIEAGTGSGSLTVALARAVGPTGKVISCDVREDMQNLAQHNLELAGLLDQVVLKLRDIADGFDEVDAPALFLDVPKPWDYLPQVHRALRGGGFFGALVPTTNQVVTLLAGLQRESFTMVEVIEIFLRHYKTLAARLRPVDRMVAHTGYLIFARSILPDDRPQSSWDSPRPPSSTP